MSNDLISRSDLHKRIFPYECTDKRGYSINAKAVEKAIQEAPSVRWDIWFNVNYTLPTKSGDVLACSLDENGNYYWIGYIPYSAKHKAFNMYDEDTSDKHKIEPQFWMPLPPSPLKKKVRHGRR